MVNASFGPAQRRAVPLFDPNSHKSLRKSSIQSSKWVLNQKYGKTPKLIIHFNRVFHYKPSILGVFPLFLVQHPNVNPGLLFVGLPLRLYLADSPHLYELIHRMRSLSLGGVEAE